MSRAEHIAWVKIRALGYVDAGDVPQALASYLSDMGKHPEADPGHVVRELAASMSAAGRLNTAKAMREFINGTH